MKVSELHTRILRELPGAPAMGLIELINDEVERLYSTFQWAHYRSRTTFDYPEQYEDFLTPGNTISLPTAFLQEDVLEGSTIDLSDEGGDPVTLTFRADDIDENGDITDPTSAVVLSSVFIGLHTDVAGSLTPDLIIFSRRSDWRLPTNFRSLRCLSNGENNLRYEYQDPYHYTLDKRPDTNRELIVWRSNGTPANDVVMDYYRKPTAISGPNDTIDVDGVMERPLYLGVLGRLITLMITGKIEDPMRARSTENTRLYEQALRDARARDSQRRAPTQANHRRNLVRLPHE